MMCCVFTRLLLSVFQVINWATEYVEANISPAVTGETSFTKEYTIPKNFTVQSRKIGQISARVLVLYFYLCSCSECHSLS